MNIVDWIESISETVSAPMVWLLGMCFATLESGLGLGFFIPGETVVLLLSATLTEWPLALGMAAAVTIGASAGDHVGYLIGRRFGPALRETRLIRRIGQAHWDRAVGILERRGAAAVFFTRLLPVVRTLTPAAAGVARVPYRSFLPASLAGAGLWAGVYVGVGFSVRGSIEGIQQVLGDVGLAVVLGLAGATVLIVLIRVKVTRRSRETVAPDAALRDASDGPPDMSLGSEDVPSPPRRTTAGPIRRFAERVTEGRPWRTLPNLITLSRIALLPVLLGLLVTRHFTAALLLGIVVFASDFVDGYLARRTGTTSPLGAWLDPVADRLAAVTVAVGFGVGQIIPFAYVVLLLIPDLVLGIVSVVAFKGTPSVTVTRMGKVRTALVFAGFACLLLGMSATEWQGARLGGLVGGGFFIALVGLVAHYVAAGQYLRTMIGRWSAAR
ncbi:CDP-alcohol phosphatidyltransferase family protein [Plantibacter sp. YIM 135347]|uniref:CDP-alcohol phosphatidyltransferase family protein n=1 Tax=Plantibacter sp. YIM 135347 TaxID=3423919 RepID=UPI003D339D31